MGTNVGLISAASTPTTCGGEMLNIMMQTKEGKERYTLAATPLAAAGTLLHNLLATQQGHQGCAPARAWIWT